VPRQEQDHQSKSPSFQAIKMPPRATDKYLLKGFSRVHVGEHGWAGNLSPYQMEQVRSGPWEPVPATIWRAIKQWIYQVLDEATHESAPRLIHAHHARCVNLSRAVIRAHHPDWLVGDYVRVKIGDDDKGDPVYEGAHRLALWADAGCNKCDGTRANPLVRNSEVCMHSRGCRTKLCVNTHHLDWGTYSENLVQSYNSKKRTRI
jgi:hypothetical protein